MLSSRKGKIKPQQMRSQALSYLRRTVSDALWYNMQYANTKELDSVNNVGPMTVQAVSVGIQQHGQFLFVVTAAYSGEAWHGMRVSLGRLYIATEKFFLLQLATKADNSTCQQMSTNTRPLIYTILQWHWPTFVRYLTGLELPRFNVDEIHNKGVHQMSK